MSGEQEQRPISPPAALPDYSARDACSAAFVQVAPLYDALMQGVPYREWIRYVQQLLAVRHAHPRHVLDLCCGTGNVSERLARHGYQVTGVDIAPAMIAEAQRKAADQGLPIDYIVQDAAALNLPGRRFDLCVSLFDSLNYITDPARLAQALERVSAHLTRGGLFLCDMNSESALRRGLFSQSSLGPDEPLRYDWRSEYFPEQRLCRVQMRFWWRAPDGTERAFEEVHWQYGYLEDEVVGMLEAAGFGRIQTFHGYTLNPPNRHTDRIFYLAARL